MICLRVERSLGQQNWVLLGCHAQLVVKRVVPDFLHIIPIGHDAVLDWVLQSEHTTLDLCFITHVGVFLVHANHDSRHLGATDNGRENCAWGIITANPALHIPLPLSTTRAATSSSAMMDEKLAYKTEN